MIFITLAVLVAAVAAPAAGESGGSMNAVVVHEFGPPDVLKLESAPRPACGESDILVRVHAAAVNPIDCKVRAGSPRVKLPYIPGFDMSGVVEQVGAKVTKFKPGEEVFAMIDLRRGGCYADYVVVKESEAAAKPAKISHTEAASAPLVALTAWQALFDAAKLASGQTVLIHGGAGGVGSMAVQLAKWKGAHVIATASKENHEFLKSIGADEVIDYHGQQFQDVVKDVDVVLDTIGGQTQADSWAVLKKGGIIVSIVGSPPQAKARELGVRAASILVHPSSDELAQIAKLLDEGKIKPVVTHVFPLKDVAKAHEQSETKHTRGKIVLEVMGAADR
jgi:NADPH:quinone reductase-like Zn-dependent oxidoreductase